MKKAELLKMLENIGDDEELNFVVNELDRDGYPEDRIEPAVYKVVGENYKVVREQYGIHRIYNA
jgi:hypothetical protein